MPSKWLRDLQAQKHAEHKRRIKNMVASVDNKPPRELPFSGKKEIERRCYHAYVEKGNRALLARLGKAMQIKNIDNEQTAKPGVSLLATKKKIELERISADNRRLLERIQKTNPVYDHVAWEREAEHREFYLRNMTEFPELYVNKYTPSEKFKKKQQQARLTISSSPSSRSGGSPLRNSAFLDKIEALNLNGNGNGGEDGGIDPEYIPAPPLEPPYRNGFLRPLSEDNLKNQTTY